MSFWAGVCCLLVASGKVFFLFSNIGGITVDISGTGIVGIGGSIGHGGKLSIGLPGGLGGGPGNGGGSVHMDRGECL